MFVHAGKLATCCEDRNGNAVLCNKDKNELEILGARLEPGGRGNKRLLKDYGCCGTTNLMD